VTDTLLPGALVQIVSEDDDSLLERFVADLPTERLAPTMVELHRLEGQMRKARGFLEGRYQEEVDAAWTDTDGEVWLWQGEARWEVKDPDGLAAALLHLMTKHPLWRDRIKESFKRSWTFNNTALNSIRDLEEEIGDTVREFRTRRFGPRHLRRQEERT